MADQWKWQRRDKKLKSKKESMPKHGKAQAQIYADTLDKKIKELEAKRKIVKEIDEFAVVASQQKLPNYGYGRPATENTSSFVPEMKEFGTAASAGFTPTFNYSGRDKKKKIIEAIHKLHESNPKFKKDKTDEIEEEAEEKEPQTELQEKILGTVENFEEKMIQNFIDGYEKMAILSKEYSNEDLGELYTLAKWVNVYKSFNLSAPKEINRLEQVLFVDNVAHNLHKQKFPNGLSLYKQLDELADISKSIGELTRGDRLLLLQSMQNMKKIEEYTHMDILQKSSLLEKSKSLWKLFERAIKFGVEKLSNRDLIVLREWIYSKI